MTDDEKQAAAVGALRVELDDLREQIAAAGVLTQLREQIAAGKFDRIELCGDLYVEALDCAVGRLLNRTMFAACGQAGQTLGLIRKC